MAATEARFTTGSTLRHVTVMSLAGSVGLSFMFLVDIATLFWVATLGDASLIAGVGIAAAIQYFNIAVGIGFAIAGTALVSRALGARQRAEARRLAASAMVLTLLALALVAILVVALRGPVVALLGAEPASAAVARDFLLIAVPSLPFFGISMICGAVLRAEGDALRAMLVTVAAGVLAMGLDPLFILGFGMGADGAAWGTALSRGGSAVLGLWFATRHHDLIARPSRADLARHLPAIRAIALPAAVTQLSAPFGNFVLTGVVAGFGDAAVAAWTVVGRLTIFAFGGLFAVSGSIGGILGQNFGAGMMDRVRSAYRDALLFCLVYTLVVWAGLALSGGAVIRLFAVPAEGAPVILAFTGLAAGAFVFTGALFVSNAAFNTLGRPLWSTGFNWLRDAALAWPFALALAGTAAAPGVVWAQALAGMVAGTLAVLAGWHFLRHRPAPPPHPEA